MPIDIQNARQPGILRHFAAMFYDFLLLLALLMLADALVTLPLGIAAGIPGQEIGAHPLFRIYLLLVIIGFFCGFWMRGGQTLGMRAWRIMLVRNDGNTPRLRDALLRLLGSLLSWAALGMGFIWSLLDPQHLTWHDRLSGTRLVMLEKRKKA